MAKYRAVFKDSNGATFSAPVEKQTDGSWIMHTSDGLQLPINSEFHDDHAGPLIFSHYREEPEPEDLRLHIDRLPGESSFGALQRAYAEKEIVEQRNQRQAARTEIQNVLPDPAKTAQARNINEEFARLKRPNGRGVGLVIGEKN